MRDTAGHSWDAHNWPTAAKQSCDSAVAGDTKPAALQNRAQSNVTEPAVHKNTLTPEVTLVRFLIKCFHNPVPTGFKPTQT